jgi:hypothetical protein
MMTLETNAIILENALGLQILTKKKTTIVTNCIN